MNAIGLATLAILPTQTLAFGGLASRRQPPHPPESKARYYREYLDARSFHASEPQSSEPWQLPLPQDWSFDDRRTLCRRCTFLKLSRAYATRTSTGRADTCRRLHSTSRLREGVGEPREPTPSRQAAAIGHAETRQQGLESRTKEEEERLEARWIEDETTVLVESIEDVVKPTDETVARQARQEHGEHLPEGHLNEVQLKIYIRLYGEPLPAREEEPAEQDPAAPEDEDALEIQRNREAWDSLAESVDGEVVWEDADADAEADAREADRPDDPDRGSRAHPFTQMGRFGTTPSTVQFPQATFVQPIMHMLAGNPSATPAHLAAAAESVFGGVGLPYSPSTPARSRQMEQRPVALRAAQARMPPSHADAWWACVAPQTYAACAAALAEARRRLGSGWVRGLWARDGGRGPSVLDVGGGGAGVLAWRDVLRAEWEAMRGEEEGESGAARSRRRRRWGGRRWWSGRIRCG